MTVRIDPGADVVVLEAGWVSPASGTPYDFTHHRPSTDPDMSPSAIVRETISMRRRISVLCVLWAVLAVGNSFAQDDVCENDVVIPDPDDHPELVEDCKILWAIKDELRGSASLNWAEDRRLMNWEGISITPVSPRRVQRIHFHEKGLDGRVPGELSKLSALEHLQLDNNNQARGGLHGGIPAELSDLSALEYLNLDHNKLDGPIPPELGHLSNLRWLDLSNNELTGSIPRELGDLSNLILDNAGLDIYHKQGLDLDHNNLTGCVPRGLEPFYNATDVNGPINVQVDPDTGQETRLSLCPAPSSLTLSIEPTRVREGESRDIQVTAMLDAEATLDATVHVVVGAGTATEGTDFTVTSPSFDIPIAGGETEGKGTFSLVVEDDFSAEGDETVAVSGSVDALSADTVHVTITDNDDAPSSLSLSVSPDTVTENYDDEITVTASFPAGSATLPQPTEVSLTVEDGTAVAGEDYAAVEPFTVTIPAGELSGEEPFTLTVIEDEAVEPDETIEIGGTAAGFTVSPAEVTINDGDVAAEAITICPDPFTPNDDSFNDRVKFSIDGLEGPTLSIYTLEGVLIHTSDDLTVMDFRCNESPNSSSSTALFWDGRDDDGQDQPAGIYLFAIRDATSVVTAGHLTLAR